MCAVILVFGYHSTCWGENTRNVRHVVDLRFRVDLFTCIPEKLRTIAQFAKTPIAPSLDTKKYWFMKHCNGYLPFFVMVSWLWITSCGIPSGLLAVECWLRTLLMDIPDYGFRAVKL